MIEYVTGTLVSADDDGVVLEAAGLGLRLRVHEPARFRAMIGTRVTLPVRLDIQARAVRLVGFRDAAERAKFDRLHAIPGVGAVTALRLLPAYDELTGAAKSLPAIPGVGPAMRAKIARWLARTGGAPVAPASVETELRTALEALGLSPAEAKTRAARVVAKAGNADLEALVRMAVRR